MMIVRLPLLLGVCLTLSGCLFKTQQEYRSHGTAIPGYGPVKFGMKFDDAKAALGARAQAQDAGGVRLLSYYDSIDYLAVRVVQHFNDDKKATRAEVYVVDAERTARSLNECKSLHASLYGMLQKRYGTPDWEPRVDRRSQGESGVMMFSFTDSSNITLNYDFTGQETSGLCKVMLGFNPPWI